MKKKLTLKDLAVNHDYYASEKNYYSNYADVTWRTFSEFYQENHDDDVDMNLIFRWDVFFNEDEGTFSAKIFIIHQRKGIYAPQIIESITESDVPQFIKLVTKHWKKLQNIWNPISL